MVVGELVQSLVGSLFLLDDDHPCCQVASYRSQLGIQRGLGVLQDAGEIAQTGVDFPDLVAAEFTVLIDAVEVGTK